MRLTLSTAARCCDDRAVAEPLEGIAGADAILGRAFPLPAAPLPLVRWVDVAPLGDGAEVVWSLDDSRAGVARAARALRGAGARSRARHARGRE